MKELYTLCLSNLAQVHAFNWTSVIISTWSTTPLLNTILFLCLHISHIMANHILFHIVFILLLNPIKWKFQKWSTILLCLTDDTPSHLLYLSHTLCPTSQLVRICWTVSSTFLHSGHKLLVTVTPLLIRLVLVVTTSLVSTITSTYNPPHYY